MTIFAFIHEVERRGADCAATFTASQADSIGRGPTGSIYVRSEKGGLKGGRTVP
jgi:hypothetical protein